MIGAGPGQGEAVKSTGVPADFVKQNQAALGGVTEDVGGIGHFYL